MRLRVACEHPGCDKWADLEWDDGGWWGGFEVDEDNERAELGLDKSFKLPVGWDVRYRGIQSGPKLDGPYCPEHVAAAIGSKG